MKPIKFIKKLINIVNNYEGNFRALQGNMTQLRRMLKERTEINADVRFSGIDRSQIIVVGRYRDADFVQVYTLNDTHLKDLICRLREMEEYGVVRKVDAAPNIKGVIKRELEV